MKQESVGGRFPVVGGGGKLAPGDTFYREEVQLASRNRGMPLEGLRYSITPTGMHYILVHFDIPEVDVKTWRLKVDGLVSNSLRLTLDEIMRRPVVTLAVTMECAGNGRALLTPRYIGQPWLLEAVGTAEWTGTPLREVLGEAGMSDQAVEILFTGLDRGVQGGEIHYYQRSLGIDEAMRGEVLLAYAMNGAPLEPQHGYPLRLIVPGWYGMASVKWLDRIEAIGEPFQGYQQLRSYRYTQTAEDPGEPATTIRVRALMLPPGIPDWLTRTRLVEAGPVTLIGRAWAGRLGISLVEVSVDGGSTWSEAQIGEAVSPYAWRAWSFIWEARPGKYTLCARATDSGGNVQPVSQSKAFDLIKKVVEFGKKIIHYEETGEKLRAEADKTRAESRRLVPDAIRLLQSEGVITSYPRKGATIWLPDRTQTVRIGRLIASPNVSGDPLVRKAAELQ